MTNSKFARFNMFRISITNNSNNNHHNNNYHNNNNKREMKIDKVKPFL